MNNKETKKQRKTSVHFNHGCPFFNHGWTQIDTDRGKAVKTCNASRVHLKSLDERRFLWIKRHRFAAWKYHKTVIQRYKAETEKIIGFAFEVLNEVGHGLSEKIYENSLTVLLKSNGLGFDQQRRFPVFFRGVEVGEFIPDLIAAVVIIVDTKAIDRITDRERGQMLNYLRITKLRVGLILNFQRPRLQWERIVL